MADSSGAKRAVIVGLLGIGCYPLSWLGAVLGVRAFLAEKEAGPRRTLAIVAMLMPGLLLPVVALESAVFRAPVQAALRSRQQSECVEMLPKLWAAEEKALAQNHRYTTDKHELDFQPPLGHHYTYLIGANAYTAGDLPTWKDHVDTADELGIEAGFSGTSFTVACITRDGLQVDAWTISNEDRVLPDAGLLPGGKLFNVFHGNRSPPDGGT